MIYMVYLMAVLLCLVTALAIAQAQELSQLKATVKQSAFNLMDRAGLYKDLAIKLEIEADGGDSPECFVEWAIRDCWKDADKILLPHLSHRL